MKLESPRYFTQALRVALVLALAAVALLKLVSGPSGEDAVGKILLYYGVAIIELSLAALLIAMRLRIAAVSLIVACGIGLVLSFLDPSVDCGCLGQYIKADVILRRMLLALGGMGGGALLVLERQLPR